MCIYYIIIIIILVAVCCSTAWYKLEICLFDFYTRVSRAWAAEREHRHCNNKTDASLLTVRASSGLSTVLSPEFWFLFYEADRQLSETVCWWPSWRTGRDRWVVAGHETQQQGSQELPAARRQLTTNELNIQRTYMQKYTRTYTYSLLLARRPATPSLSTDSFRRQLKTFSFSN